MIKFINIGNQLGYSEKDRGGVEFAFYDTVRDKFLEFNGESVWWGYGAIQHDLLEELEDDQIDEDYYERVLGLIPEELK